MLEPLIIVTGIVIVGMSLYGYLKTRDPLFPLTILGPMLLYVYVYSPLMRISTGSLASIFPDPEQLVPVHVINLLAVSAFCIGCTWRCRRPRVDKRYTFLRQQITPRARKRMTTLAVVLGIIACAGFAYMVDYSGGWVHVFSKAKPQLLSPSGYIGEMPMLSYPAVFVLAFAFQGRRMTFRRWLLMVLILLPQIIMATLGGRRGPMFLVSCSLFGSWCIIHSRRPRLSVVASGMVALGCMLLLLQANRGNLFRPWQEDIDTSFVEQLWSTPEVNYGDEYVVASATILTTSEYMHHYWGTRYFATFIIRPIPRFIWPTKYQDVGLDWMRTAPGKSGIPTSQWLDAVGFEPAGGAAGGFVADLFLEFSWGCIGVSFLLGLFFAAAWRRWVNRGGLWTLLYFEVMILSVHLIVQSLGAWLYRVILVVVLTSLFWKWNVGSRRMHTSATHRSLGNPPPREPAAASYETR